MFAFVERGKQGHFELSNNIQYIYILTQLHIVILYCLIFLYWFGWGNILHIGSLSNKACPKTLCKSILDQSISEKEIENVYCINIE